MYLRNDHYNIIDLHFFEKQHVEKYPLIDLFKLYFRKVKLYDNSKIHYDERIKFVKFISKVLLQDNEGASFEKKRLSADYAYWSI